MLRLLEPDDALPERALLARISAGDRRAFDELVTSHLERCLTYAYALVQSADAAEDIAQGVFCWVWDNRLSLRVQKSVRVYLLSAVRHRALDYLRAQRREGRSVERYAREDEVPGMAMRPSAPDTRATQGDLASALERAIDELPERRREIVLLRWRQFSYGEIAEMLGISVKTVEAQVTSAFAALRERLAPWVR